MKYKLIYLSVLNHSYQYVQRDIFSSDILLKIISFFVFNIYMIYVFIFSFIILFTKFKVLFYIMHLKSSLRCIMSSDISKIVESEQRVSVLYGFCYITFGFFIIV